MFDRKTDHCESSCVISGCLRKPEVLNLTGRVKFVSRNRQLANISETKGRRASRIAASDAELNSDTFRTISRAVGVTVFEL
jgi:hypothetical protein